MMFRKPQSLASRIFWLYGLSILLAAVIGLGLLIRQEFVQHIADSEQSVKKWPTCRCSICPKAP